MNLTGLVLLQSSSNPYFSGIPQIIIMFVVFEKCGPEYNIN